MIAASTTALTPCNDSGGGTTEVAAEVSIENLTPTVSTTGSVPNAMAVPEGTGNCYSTMAALRAGFAPGSSSVNVYSCLQRTSDRSARNCSLLGSGRDTIESLGDGRVLRFTGLPATNGVFSQLGLPPLTP